MHVSHSSDLTRTQFSRCALSVSGPDIWYTLPPNLRLIDSHSASRLTLKASFNTAFSFRLDSPTDNNNAQSTHYYLHDAMLGLGLCLRVCHTLINDWFLL